MLHTHNTFKNFIKNILLASTWIFISVLVMILFMYSLLFAGYQFKNPMCLKLLHITIPIFVIIAYLYYLKKCHLPSLFCPKFTRPLKINWSIKISIIYFAFIFNKILGNLVYTGKSENQKELDENQNDFLTNILSSGIRAPIIEEIIFRGVLFIIILTATSFWFYKSHSKTLFIRLALYVILSTIIFSLLHVLDAGDYHHIFPYLVSGFIYSIVFAFTRDIKVSILLHMLNNISVQIYKNNYNWFNDVIFTFLLLSTIIGLIIYFKSDDFKKFRNNIKYKQYVKTKDNAKKITGL